MAQKHTHVRSWAVLATSEDGNSGMIATPCKHCGALIGPSGSLVHRSYGTGIATGSVLVGTPRFVLGTMTAREEGGIFDHVKNAPQRTLLDQLTLDPRGTVEEGIALFDLVETYYGTKN